jgi:hypothetical protein
VDWHRPPYTVSDDPARLDLDVVHAYLARSYWAAGIPRALVARSLAHSLCLGLYRREGERAPQVGFARAISDRATFAYLSDVFVLEEERGRGLGRFLVECLRAHPELQGLRRWMLVTQDAQGLYARLGWRLAARPGDVMEIVRPDPYRS